MSNGFSIDGLRQAAFLGTVEGIQLLHLLQPKGGIGTVVQLIAAGDGAGTSSLARDLCLIAVREAGLRVVLLDLDGAGRAQAAWLRDSHDLPLTLAGSISARPTALAVLRVGTSQLHVSERQNELTVPASAWPGVLRLLRARFDLVVADSPALSRSYDGVLFAPHADGSVLVIEAERSRTTELRMLRDRLVEIGGKVLGTVLNKRRFYIPQELYERV